MKKTLFLFLLLTLNSISFTAQSKGRKNLIVYFTEYQNTGVDALSSASRVWQDKQYMGITEAMAKLLQQFLGGDLLAIQMEESYPPEWESLMEKAAVDEYNSINPKIKNFQIDLSSYHKVFLAYPIWHKDMPRALYTFLEQYDLSGKNIYLMTASNEGPAKTKASVSRMESQANVSSKVLDIRNSYVEEGSLYTRVRAWAKSL